MTQQQSYPQAGNFIAGRARPATDAATRPVLAPATGATIGQVAWSGPVDVRAAVDAAAAAAPGWAAMGMTARRDALLRWGDAVAAAAEDIAMADAVNSGTPIRNMRVGVVKGLDYLRFYAGLWSEVKGQTIPASPNHLHYTQREPYGPVGIIIPFNHPTLFGLSKTVPALIAGNTVVLKPSELTPLSAAIFAAASAGHLPPGVFNVVNGGPEVGAAIVAEPRLDRLHFTGGVATGLRVQRGAADSGRVKHVSLELGGKNPLIVLPDADPDVVATAAVVGMNYTRNQGQSCGSTSRLFVHADIADEVIERVCGLVEAIRLGPPEDEATEMGSLISVEHQQRVLAAVSEGRQAGAKVLIGGAAPGGDLGRGAYVLPTVMDRVPVGSALATREIFGPVLSVLKWTERDDMLDQVNGTDYGLTAAIYTRDIGHAMTLVRDVQAGYVWVNTIETRWPATPFGGFKNSGLGSEHSLDEIMSYTRTKSVNIAVPA
jgi:acyl-CoA reductase-like NAD-dependent aldehyde dehydrogenase